MKKTWLALPLAALSILAAAAVPAAADPAEAKPKVSVGRAENGRAIKDIYVVAVKDGVDIDKVLSNAKIKETKVVSPGLNSFSAKLSKHQVEALQEDSGVEVILEDRWIVTSSATGMENWHLPADEPAPGWAADRINQAALPLDNSYTTTATGAGVTAYVIDGGIDITHPDFGGRASEGITDIITEPQTAACGGFQHGTGVAGVLGGTKYGVAKQAKLVSLRITGCDGRSTMTNVHKALNWVLGHAQKPAVVNLSFNVDGPGNIFDQWESLVLRGLVNNLAENGMFITNSTSNRGNDACLAYPAEAAGVVAVAHTDKNDHAADSSDWGPCIQLYAPGEWVPMPMAGGGFAIGRGSSFAAPMVSGVGALYKSTYGDAHHTVITNWIKDKSTKDVVLPKLNGNATPNTVNRLLNTGGL
ncbi:S8 family serine peptidase [Nocardia huaxiensis]|uniref:S8 family serine peptidase n=1 Tax=Nocardia huaxiensis TaxID=2755382 RepID=A0A7D6VEZ6_9NOCA|nr:S8 family serine peptidase [Nocardia huaxiensis]QLY28090.1 S8 family serine peptidase [Nocardia huaxiensis]